MVVARSVTFPKYVATIDDKQRLGTPGCGHTFREVSDGFGSMGKVALPFASVCS